MAGSTAVQSDLAASSSAICSGRSGKAVVSSYRPLWKSGTAPISTVVKGGQWPCPSKASGA